MKSIDLHWRAVVGLYGGVVVYFYKGDKCIFYEEIGCLTSEWLAEKLENLTKNKNS